MLETYGTNQAFDAALMHWLMHTKDTEFSSSSVYSLGLTWKIAYQIVSFYVLLPEAPPTHLSTRTFIVQPKRTSREMEKFTPARNKQAADEVQGHTGMFDVRTNDGYYNLGLTTANVIRQAIQKANTSKLNGASEKDNV